MSTRLVNCCPYADPTTRVVVNLDIISSATPTPGVLGGPNTLTFTDGTSVIIVERLEDISGDSNG